MLFNVFNKRPSANAIKEAMSTSDIQEQMECLAYATAKQAKPSLHRFCHHMIEAPYTFEILE